MNLNKELHEEFEHSGDTDWSNPTDVCIDGLWYPNYKADPRLVVREMEKREDWPLFLSHLCSRVTYDHAISGTLNLIMDETGKIRDLAIEWMKE
jgi:biotin synthase-related radical SAM superfamily protein